MIPYTCEQFVKHLNKEIKTIFQLGASDAHDTEHMISFYNPDTLVFFECHPGILHCGRDLVKNYKGKTELHFIEKAIHSYTGELDIWSVPLDDPRKEGFESSSIYRNKTIVEQNILKLPCTTLDEESKRLGIDTIDLICADIEGNELNAFTNQDILNRTSYIITEVGVDKNWRPGNPVLDDLVQHLSQYGFVKKDFYWGHVGCCGEALFVNERFLK
jgi:FkbM family methyltransferase